MSCLPIIGDHNHCVYIAEESQSVAVFGAQVANVHAGLRFERLKTVKPSFDEKFDHSVDFAVGMINSLHTVSVGPVHQAFVVRPDQLPVRRRRVGLSFP